MILGKGMGDIGGIGREGVGMGLKSYYNACMYEILQQDI